MPKFIIFIIKKDFYGLGEATYPIERINLAMGKSFEDGEHIPKGVSEMCQIIENMRNESLKEGMQEEKRMTVLRMLGAGKYVMEEIVNISGLSFFEAKKLKAERTV